MYKLRRSLPVSYSAARCRLEIDASGNDFGPSFLLNIPLILLELSAGEWRGHAVQWSTRPEGRDEFARVHHKSDNPEERRKRLFTTEQTSGAEIFGFIIALLMFLMLKLNNLFLKSWEGPAKMSEQKMTIHSFEVRCGHSESRFTDLRLPS